MKTTKNTYVLEKSISAMKSLLYLLKRVDHNQEKFKEFIETHIEGCLYDLTKIASVSADVEWKTDDNTLIMNESTDGLEQLLVRYSCINQTTKQKEALRYKAFCNEAVKLLSNEESYPSRTLLHQLIDETDMEASIVSELLSGLYRVSTGEKSWNDFRFEAIETIKGS